MILYKNKNITIFQSPIYQTNTSIIETEDMVLVIDPTTLPHEIIEIRNYVSSIRKNRPTYVLFTHSDWDHILGYNSIGDVMYIGSEKITTRDDKKRISEQIKSFDDQYYLIRDYEVGYPHIDYLVNKDGQQLKIGNTIITFYTSPGHTEDSVFTIIEPIGIFLSGDYLSDIEFPYIYSSSYAYENTMTKVDNILQHHSIHLLIPGHGNPTEDCQEILKRKTASLYYIHELRSALENEDDKRADKLLEEWQFPKIMGEYHKGNKDLIKKELQTTKY
ncbi:MBL fold metallo-hydrolase [Alkaliphilus peptidifermentans]|uniref:Glyoxylase, beta-lactamase superfamily II n=1 Tax=Alkaliphilus peptidifermentans DSM 18978 TaxID=1120976 RepID=A0A1G5K906_9FIRM|nr:MBL fold metallo-hydrolase [Alkaliphilus peptidifermentans]SCY97126.1 Glyoxylase, beta-lactamase superfamily II [Alkaliphilus peptidifermentans DSM 18978]